MSLTSFNFSIISCSCYVRLRVSLLCLLLGCLLGIPTDLLGSESLYVQTISVLGNRKTRNPVILRELTFQVGDSIPTDKLPELVIRNQQNLYNLGLFNTVIIHPEILQGNIYFILTVQERWYIFPVPRIKIEERNTYDLIDALTSFNFRRFAYGLSLNVRNMTGRNESLFIYGQLGFSKRLTIDYKQPALFPRQNIDMTAGFRFINEKEVIYGTERGLVQWGRVETEPFQRSHSSYFGLRKRFSVYSSIFGEINYNHYSFSDSLYTFQLKGEQARYVTNDLGKEYYPSIVGGYTYDRRDIKAFPLSGIKYQAFFRVTGGPESIATTRFAKIGATWAHHLPLSKHWNFAYGLHQVFTLGKQLPYYEKNFIGVKRREFPNISSNLRGYQPYAIDGSSVSMGKAELKYALIPRKIVHLPNIPFKRFQHMPLGVYLTAFGDFGYIADSSFNNQDPFLKNKLLTGYGLGLNLIGIYDFLLRVEYGRNHLGEGGIYLHGSVPIK